jgi:hypothetical protein
MPVLSAPIPLQGPLSGGTWNPQPPRLESLEPELFPSATLRLLLFHPLPACDTLPFVCMYRSELRSGNVHGSRQLIPLGSLDRRFDQPFFTSRHTKRLLKVGALSTLPAEPEHSGVWLQRRSEIGAFFAGSNSEIHFRNAYKSILSTIPLLGVSNALLLSITITED